MLFFALLFAGLAVFGACIGLGTVGQPIYGQLPNPYGWGLCINGAALAFFFVYTRVRRSLRARRIARAEAPSASTSTADT